MSKTTLALNNYGLVTVHSNEQKEYAWLDWLRFLAALLVVAGHLKADMFAEWSNLDAASRGVGTAAFYAIARLGTEAVAVFFVLSGFLVGGRLIERALVSDLDLRRYAVDRVTRIYVPLVPAIALTVLVGFVVGLPVEPGQVGGNLLSLQGAVVPVLPGNGPLWSLTYEVWFYIGAGAVVWFATTRNILPFCVVLATFVIFALLDTFYVFCWVSGALAYLVRARDGAPRASLMYAGLLLSVIALVFRQISSEGAMKMDLGLPSEALEAAALVVFSGGFGLFISQALATRTPKNGFGGVSYRMGATLAAFSYTLYLVHEPILTLVFTGREAATTIGLSGVLVYLAALGALLLIAFAFYLPFERNTAAVRHWIWSRLTRQLQSSL